MKTPEEGSCIMSELSGRRALLERQPWLTFLLPFIVFMLVGTMEPTPEVPGGEALGLHIPYSYYPLLYTLKMVLTMAAVWFVLPGYRQFPLRISPLAVVVGVVGVFIWVGLCLLKIESRYLAPALESIHIGGLSPRASEAVSIRCKRCRPRQRWRGPFWACDSSVWPSWYRLSRSSFCAAL
jgi:hypothetical protein